MYSRYRTIRETQLLEVHPSSVLYVEKYPPYVIFNEVLLTSQKYMRDITAVEAGWLSELAPHFYDFKPQVKTVDDNLPRAKRLRIGPAPQPP